MNATNVGSAGGRVRCARLGPGGPFTSVRLGDDVGAGRAHALDEPTTDLVHGGAGLLLVRLGEDDHLQRVVGERAEAPRELPGAALGAVGGGVEGLEHGGRVDRRLGVGLEPGRAASPAPLDVPSRKLLRPQEALRRGGLGEEGGRGEIGRAAGGLRRRLGRERGRAGQKPDPARLDEGAHLSVGAWLEGRGRVDGHGGAAPEVRWLFSGRARIGEQDPDVPLAAFDAGHRRQRGASGPRAPRLPLDRGLEGLDPRRLRIGRQLDGDGGQPDAGPVLRERPPRREHRRLSGIGRRDDLAGGQIFRSKLGGLRRELGGDLLDQAPQGERV